MVSRKKDHQRFELIGVEKVLTLFPNIIEQKQSSEAPVKQAFQSNMYTTSYSNNIIF